MDVPAEAARAPTFWFYPGPRWVDGMGPPVLGRTRATLSSAHPFQGWSLPETPSWTHPEFMFHQLTGQPSANQVDTQNQPPHPDNLLIILQGRVCYPRLTNEKLELGEVKKHIQDTLWPSGGTRI